MTTENEELVELPDRDIDALLKLDTYQDMTDSEIDKVIEWKVKMAVSKAVVDTLSEEFVAQAARLEVSNAQALADSQAFLDTIMNRTYPLVEVSYE